MRRRFLGKAGAGVVTGMTMFARAGKKRFIGN
jgi:hypothetical protein